MSVELEKIITQYRTFTNGQYVAHDQFNEFLESFEDQDRLSRVLLRGVGIVCGFKINVSSDNSITITAGNAVTTDGDLLLLDDSKNKYYNYRDYDNYKVAYTPFYKNDNIEGGSLEPHRQINLYELVGEDQIDVQEKKPLSDLRGLSNMYVVLYLESYEKEARPCKGVDCDNYGVEKIQNLKVLLTDEAGIVQLSKTDSVYNSFNGYQTLYKSLKGISLKRPVLSEATNTSSKIYNLYATIVSDTNLQNEIVENFKKITTYFNFDNALDEISLSEAIQAFFSGVGSRGFQYVFTFISELINTYTEVKELISVIETLGFPYLKAFQKHVMLGNLNQNNKTYRHQFYSSPIVNEKSVLDQIYLLINRFNKQIRGFSNIETLNEIRVIPSSVRPALGEKAIPFYYRGDEIRKHWDIETTTRRNFENILSYFPSSADTPIHIKDYIDYNLDQASFFRIEGHLGKNYKDAKEFIDNVKFEKQLDFDVVLVSLEKLDPNQGDEDKANYADYLKKHPGIEHKSGVYAGGTFIMFYESEKNPKVFADFTIPYLCCPTKYDISLTIPKDVVCRDAEDFIVVAVPLLATVKAFIKDKEIDVIRKKAGQNYFVPSLVPEATEDIIVTFTVNDKLVEDRLIVKPAPVVTITTSVQAPEAIGGKYIITYSGLVSDFDYVLDFQGDGNTEVMLPNKQGEFIKLFSTKSDGFNVVSKVYVTNSTTGCTSEYNIKVESLQDISIISVNFPDGKDCCSGLEIDEVSYIKGQYVYCLKDAGAIPFIIKTVNDQPFDTARTRFKLSSEPTSNWKEHTIKDVNNPALPRITSLGVYDVQIRIAYEGQETDWFTCPNFEVIRCGSEV